MIDNKINLTYQNVTATICINIRRRGETVTFHIHIARFSCASPNDNRII